MKDAVVMSSPILGLPRDARKCDRVPHSVGGGTGMLDYRQTCTMLAIYPAMLFTTGGLRSMLHLIPGSRGEGSGLPWSLSDN